MHDVTRVGEAPSLQSDEPMHGLDRAGSFLVGVICLVTVATVYDALRWLPVIHPDWKLVTAAAFDLFSPRGAQVYAEHPLVQMGPLAIALARLDRPVYIALVAVLLGPTLFGLAAPAFGVLTRRRILMACLTGGLLVAPWAQLAWKGHADDALVLFGAAVVVAGLTRASERRRRAWALAGLAVAVAGKPTGIALVPLIGADAVGLCLAGLVVLAVWFPFVVASPRALLEAGRGVMATAPGSFPAYVGAEVHGAPPPWSRAIQLVAGVVAPALGTLSRQPVLGLLLAFTVRAFVEPNPAPAYSIPLVVFAWAYDLAPGRCLPLPSICRSTVTRALHPLLRWDAKTEFAAGDPRPRRCWPKARADP